MFEFSTNTANKPYFGAVSIEVCNYSRIAKKLKNGIEVSPFCAVQNIMPKYIIEEAKQGENIGTRLVRMCNMGVISNKTAGNNIGFHLFPDTFMEALPENLIKLDDLFRNSLNGLNKKDKPDGIIFGGYASSLYENSRHLMVILNAFFKKFKIKPVILWGTDCLTEKHAFFEGKDTWHLNAKDLSAEDPLFENLTTKEKFMDSFEIIRIPAGNKVKFVDTVFKNSTGRNFKKGQLNLTLEDVLEAHGLNPQEIEKTFNLKTSKSL